MIFNTEKMYNKNVFILDIDTGEELRVNVLNAEFVGTLIKTNLLFPEGKLFYEVIRNKRRIEIGSDFIFKKKSEALEHAAYLLRKEEDKNERD